MTIKTNKVKLLTGKDGAFGGNFFIKEVYPGYLEAFVGQEGSKVKRTFKYFPKVDEKILRGGLMEDGTKLTKEDEVRLGREPREQIWNNDTKKFDFHKVVADAAFYKTYPKHFDLVIVSEKEITLPEWDKESRTNIPTATNEFTLTLKVSKLKELIDGTIEDPIPMETVNRGGEEKTYPVRGWEDSFKDKLKGVFFKVKAVNSGKQIGETVKYDVYDYTFKEAKEFDTGVESTKQKETDPELGIFDIPF